MSDRIAISVMKVMKVMKAGWSVGKMDRAAPRAKRVLASITSITFIASITFLTAATAAAAEAEKFGAPQAAERVATPGAGSLVQVTLSLMLVLGAVFAAAWLVRRVKTFGKFGSGPIEIIADVSIGAKERAVLVQVGGKQLLLGVAPGRVNTLHVLDEPVAIDRQRASGDGQRVGDGLQATGDSQSDGAQRPDFKAILKRSLGL